MLDGMFHRGDHYLRFFRDGGFLDVQIRDARDAAPPTAAHLARPGRRRWRA